MKVGTDSLILGSWANVHLARHVLDIGCGTGILSLMVCQRQRAGGHVTAIDIDDNAVFQTRQNVQNSPWPERVSAIQCDLKSMAPDEPFDAVICNPPYFRDTKVGTRSHLRQSHARQLARQQPSLDPQTLFKHAARVCIPAATLHCLYPTAQHAAILTMAQREGWHLKRKLTVFNHLEARSHVTAYCFTKKVTDPQHATLIIKDEQGQYTQQYKTLCQPFYLAF